MKLKKLLNKINNMVSNDRYYQLARFISLLIAIEGYIMVFVCLRDKNYTMAYTSASYGTLMLFTFIYTSITKRLNVFYIVAVFIIYALELIFLIGGGSSGFGIIWMLIIPIFTVYVMEFKSFLILNGICWLIIILGLWTPLNAFIYDYSTVFEARFPIVFGLIFIFSSFLSSRIRFTENQLKKQKDILIKEIEQAASIQKAFYRQELKYFEKYSVGYRTIPMAGVSGDLYDFYSTENKLEGLGIFDVSGHGVSSGLLTLLSRTIINKEFYSNKDAELWEIVQIINDRFIEEKGQVENYLTGIMMRIHEDNIEYVNAGHLSPIFYKKETDSIEILERDKRAVGAIGMRDVNPFYYSQYLKMDSGDRILLFTDGITDCINEDGEAFGMKRLMESFEKTILTPPEEQIQLILDTVKRFQKSAPAEDDITLVILKKD